MDFMNLLYFVGFSIVVIFISNYCYTWWQGCSSNNEYNGRNAISEFDYDAHAAHQLQSNTSSVAEPDAPLNPIMENPDGTTTLVATGDDYRQRIPLSEPSRTPQQEGLGNGLSSNGGASAIGMAGGSSIPGPAYEPVQLLNPIPNDRLMPISGAKDDPIRTRLDTAESMGLYQNILEKEMGQTSSSGANKNRFFEMGVRDSAYHLYGAAEGNSFDKQQQFGGSASAGAPLIQPKHRNFDLGMEINYKELDQKMYADKQKYSGNLMAAAAATSLYH